jgi:HD-GYP domain-containing protein (c-di-GMP phosphodiesterase class II)
MGETQVLLGKIAALRKRLEQAQNLVRDAGSAATALAEGRAGGRASAAEALVAASAEHDALLDAAVRPVTVAASPDAPALPRQLTSRARRVLERGRDLLGRLRGLADAFAPAVPAPAVPDDGVPRLGRHDPLAVLYRETASMTDTALRMVPLFPDTATAQMQLCEGVEGILNAVATRLATVTAGVERHQKEAEQVGRLSGLLTSLEAGEPVTLEHFAELAEDVLGDADDGGPLRFLEAGAADPARFVACHSLTVARVVARVVRHDPDLRQHALEAVLAALVHDAGMLRVPAEILAHRGPLDDDQRRCVEAHTRDGAELAACLAPGERWLIDAAACHHERLDGTGYPDGLREPQLAPLTRLLAVCDAYAAQCGARPYRPARDTRTALTDTLLLAEQGLLDRAQAEHLLHLSFYPVGAAVELADGAVGVVVAAPGPRRDLGNPARPVVALLADSQGEALPLPRHLDLTRQDGPGVVRTLPAAERRAVLGRRFPEWA